MRSNLSGILILSGLLAGVAQAATPIVITGCQTLNIPGAAYILAADVSAQPDVPCFTIAGADITLNMDGHSITPSLGGGFRIGVRVTAAGSGAKIQDGNILNFTDENADMAGFGIVLDSVVGARVTGMTITGNTYGVQLVQADNNRVDGNKISSPIFPIGTGIMVDVGSDNNNIGGNQCDENGSSCVFITGGDTGNTVIGNTMNNNRFGVYVVGPANEIRNNSITGGFNGVGVNSNAHDNIVRTNTITGAGYGISLDNFASGNVIRDNTVSGSGILDILDSDRDCNDTYRKNTFTTWFGPTGCIQ